MSLLAISGRPDGPLNEKLLEWAMIVARAINRSLAQASQPFRVKVILQMCRSAGANSDSEQEQVVADSGMALITAMNQHPLLLGGFTFEYSDEPWKGEPHKRTANEGRLSSSLMAFWASH